VQIALPYDHNSSQNLSCVILYLEPSKQYLAQSEKSVVLVFEKSDFEEQFKLSEQCQKITLSTILRVKEINIQDNTMLLHFLYYIFFWFGSARGALRVLLTKPNLDFA